MAGHWLWLPLLFVFLPTSSTSFQATRPQCSKPRSSDAECRKIPSGALVVSHVTSSNVQDSKQSAASISAQRSQNKRWDEMFDKLKAYKKTYGHCLVPGVYKEDRALGSWVATQRRFMATMPEERRKRLDEIGFVWSVRTRKDRSTFAKYQEEMFGRLVAYQKEHGCCEPPRKSIDGGLYYWVYRQEMQYRSGELAPHRQQQLLSVGISFE